MTTDTPITSATWTPSGGSVGAALNDATRPSLREITERLTQRYSDLDQRLDQIEAHLADIVDATDALLHAHGICSNCHRPVETCDAEIPE